MEWRYIGAHSKQTAHDGGDLNEDVGVEQRICS